MMEKIVGDVQTIIFRNEETGYTVFEFKVEGAKRVTCVGLVFDLYVGETIELSGVRTTHPSYGSQFSFSSYTALPIRTQNAMLKYLSSGMIRGIGEKTAERMVDEFGEKTFEIIEDSPDQLARIKGITKERAAKISEDFISKKKMRDTVIGLQKYEISVHFAIKIFTIFGEKAEQKILSNPYILVSHIEGIGFKYADKIAFKLGFSKNSLFRIKEGIKYILKLSSFERGHVFLPEETLITEVEKILEIPNHKEVIWNLLFELENEDQVVLLSHKEYGKAIYLKYFYMAEKYIGSKLKMLSDFGLNQKQKETSKEIEKIEKGEGIELSKEQKGAILSAIENNVTIITGGPGTGKTTIMNILLKYFEEKKQKVKLVAPTGRASKKLAEATRHESQTIHRLLEVMPSTIEEEMQHFGRNEENPIQGDVLIIDEMSMVDILLFLAVLKAMPQGMRLVLVGDSKQLPSVGPGNVLKDLIHSEKIKTVELIKIFRQSRESMIITNAHLIRNGELPILDEKGKDFFFIHARDPYQVVEEVTSLVSSRLTQYLNCSHHEIQVLVPMKKGITGVENLNSTLQSVLNASAKEEIKANGKSFKVNDRVMHIKNDYELEWRKLNQNGYEEEKGLGVFNGDTGRIDEVNEFTGGMTIQFDDDKICEYNASNLKELELAYAITVHKSQGSEYKAVVIPLFDVPTPLLSRNLIYTAITRARELVVIVGRKEIIQSMVVRDFEEKRYTMLREEIVERFE